MFKTHAQSLFQINDVKMMSKGTNERRLKALKKIQTDLNLLTFSNYRCRMMKWSLEAEVKNKNKFPVVHNNNQWVRWLETNINMQLFQGNKITWTNCWVQRNLTLQIIPFRLQKQADMIIRNNLANNVATTYIPKSVASSSAVLWHLTAQPFGYQQ